MSLNENKKFTFAFIRHGLSCQNISNVLSRSKPGDFDINSPGEVRDPELSQIGVEAAKIEGNSLVETLETFENQKIGTVFCSQLFRTMDTAVALFQSKLPNKIIHVVPYLRELDESGKKGVLQNIDGYAAQNETDQIEKMKLLSLPYHLIDYSFFNKEQYGVSDQPGDILEFFKWFYSKFNKELENDSVIICVTHHGVIKDFFGKGVDNLGGFLLPNVTNQKINSLVQENLSLDSSFSLSQKQFYKNKILTEHFNVIQITPEFSTADYIRGLSNENMCPSKRCGQICQETGIVGKMANIFKGSRGPQASEYLNKLSQKRSSSQSGGKITRKKRSSRRSSRRSKKRSKKRSSRRSRSVRRK